MNVLLIGSGGREHAIAWKLAQSPKLDQLYIAPGNAGTAAVGKNVSVNVNDHAAVIDFAKSNTIGLVCIGPEAPLAAGLGDALTKVGIPVFGPSQAAAQIEASKAFSKDFMARHNLPTARYKVFTDFDAALSHTQAIDYPIVIKASGLAAGKGVILPESAAETEQTLRDIMLDGRFGGAGAEVVIEERMSGPEVSLLAFSDGTTVKPMPPAQDHKRLLEGDAGPNTGGMGTYAPTPIADQVLIEAVMTNIMQPAIDGLRSEGTPFVGVLYAGLMLTESGPSLLEFNCRFGDPETQVILPLLQTDLLEITYACATGTLADIDIQWSDDAAACVVLASGGYPGSYPKGKPIAGLADAESDNSTVFHAGTALDTDTVVTSGGRVLGVTGWGADFKTALDNAYAAVDTLSFEGAQFRRDIGYQALALTTSKGAYAESGVNIEAGNEAVRLISDAVASTQGPEVLAGVGAFGGLFDISALQRVEKPALVASTDGVGTKVKLATQLGRYRGIGHDIVNHCVDDILVQGARPLFFLDYIAAAQLEPAMVAEVVIGMTEACKACGAALLGGETAEMPGVYHDGAFDVAGTIVGTVAQGDILPRTADIQVGDMLIGFASSGPHTNGYSLIRKLVADQDLDQVLSDGQTLADALLAPHRNYVPLIQPLIDTGAIKALAHITGGGIIENLPRALPDGMGADIYLGAWQTPPVFELLQTLGNIDQTEMYRVFNMGIGMVAVIDESDMGTIIANASEPVTVIGTLTGTGEVQLLD